MFFLYDEQGVVTQSVSAADEAGYRAFLVDTGTAFVEVVAPPAPSIEDLVVIDGELVVREPMGATISAMQAAVGEPVTLAGLPAAAFVTIFGPHQTRFTADEPTEVLVFDVPGVYRIAVEDFPRRTARFELEVTP